jgi:hypothetical protein
LLEIGGFNAEWSKVLQNVSDWEGELGDSNLEGINSLTTNGAHMRQLF